MIRLVGIRKWLMKKWVKLAAPFRRRKLKRMDFTIISNNCWAGDVYRYFGIQYQTPTVGLYFWAEDYIRFLSRIEEYLTLPLEFISVEKSNYRDELFKKGQQDKIIGRLGDVEIVFLHYASQEQAQKDWDRRKKRINMTNLIVKFSRQNLCTDRHVEQFLSLPFPKKVFFDNRPIQKSSCVYIAGYEKDKYLKDDISDYKKYMDIMEFLNR